MAADTLVLVVVVAREVIVMVVRVSGMIVIVEIVVVVVVSIVKTVVGMLVMTAMIVVAVMVIALIKMNWMVEFVVVDKIAVFVGYIFADYKLVEEAGYKLEEAGCDIFVEVVGKFVAGLLIEFDTVMDCMVDYMIEAGFELPIVKEEEEVEKPECEAGIVAAALTKTAVEKVLEEGRTFFFFLFSSFLFSLLFLPFHILKSVF